MPRGFQGGRPVPNCYDVPSEYNYDYMIDVLSERYGEQALYMYEIDFSKRIGFGGIDGQRQKWLMDNPEK